MSQSCRACYLADPSVTTPWSKEELKVGDLSLEPTFSGTSHGGGSRLFVFDVLRGGSKIGESEVTLGDDGNTPYAGHVGGSHSAHFWGSDSALRLTKHLFSLAKRAGSSDLLLTIDPNSRLMNQFCADLGAAEVDTVDVPDGIDLHGLPSVKRFRVDLA